LTVSAQNVPDKITAVGRSKGDPRDHGFLHENGVGTARAGPVYSKTVCHRFAVKVMSSREGSDIPRVIPGMTQHYAMLQA